jgi:hypothetical protein
VTSSAAPLAPTTHQELKTDRINEGLLPVGLRSSPLGSGGWPTPRPRPGRRPCVVLPLDLLLKQDEPGCQRMERSWGAS